MEGSDLEHQVHDGKFERRDTRNWIICFGIVALAIGCSAYWLLTSPSCTPTLSLDTGLVLGFNGFVAIAGLVILITMALDPMPLATRYRVPSRPEIPEVAYVFTYYGHWSTFTLWSNTLGVAYFWLALVVGLLQRSHGAASESLTRATGVLWEIIFPMSFFVNIVVSFVLIPVIKKQGKFDILWVILKWRPQALHNGFVIVTTIEALHAAPQMQFRDFPVLVMFGTAYIVFSWFLFARTAVFHYYFLDPRFEWAPAALVALLLLLSGIYFLCYYAIELASDYLMVKVLLLGMSFATCTFSDKDAVSPSQLHCHAG